MARFNDNPPRIGRVDGTNRTKKEKYVFCVEENVANKQETSQSNTCSGTNSSVSREIIIRFDLDVTYAGVTSE